MVQALRQRSTPEELAKSQQVIDLKASLSDFQRLARIVDDDLSQLAADERPAEWRAQPVAVSLAFRFADIAGTLPAVEGRVATRVDAVCQRCLEVCALQLEAELKAVLVGDTAGAVQQEGYEVWELQESTFRPLELVEEALIMVWPLSVQHASPAACGRLAERIGTGPSMAKETVRPFAGLKALVDGKKTPPDA